MERIVCCLKNETVHKKELLKSKDLSRYEGEALGTYRFHYMTLGEKTFRRQ